MSEWKKVKIGDFLTESKIIAEESDAAHRITVRLNCKGIEQRALKAEKEGATKYYTRKSGQFIYGKQNIHKGAFGIIPQELDGFTSSADLPAFDVDLSKCIPEWICICLQKDEYYKTLQKNVKGVGSQRLAVNVFLDSEIPLPPVEKQVEIIKKIQLQLQKTEQLSFEIESQKNYAKLLRQNILQEAIEGKLTEDWRKKNPVQKDNPDYDAEALFEKIQNEKYHTDSILLTQNQDKKKKGKSLDFPNPCDNEEKPFAIPDGWKWVRLGDVIEYTENLDIQKKLKGTDLIKYVDIDSIDNQNYKIRNYKEKSVAELSSRARRVLRKDYIIYSTVRPYLCNIAIIKREYPNYIGSTGFNVFRTIGTIKEYVFYFLLSDYIINLYKGLMQGFNSPSINNQQFENTMLPLPPLTEQKEIVEQVEKYLQTVTELENQIAEREQLAKQLMQSILREAFEEN